MKLRNLVPHAIAALLALPALAAPNAIVTDPSRVRLVVVDGLLDYNQIDVYIDSRKVFTVLEGQLVDDLERAAADYNRSFLALAGEGRQVRIEADVRDPRRELRLVGLPKPTELDARARRFEPRIAKARADSEAELRSLPSRTAFDAEYQARNTAGDGAALYLSGGCYRAHDAGLFDADTAAGDSEPAGSRAYHRIREQPFFARLCPIVREAFPGIADATRAPAQWEEAFPGLLAFLEQVGVRRPAVFFQACFNPNEALFAADVAEAFAQAYQKTNCPADYASHYVHGRKRR